MRCWKKYKVRPDSNSDTPELTNPKYCIYDEPNDKYLFTKEWVEFLSNKLANPEEFDSLYNEKI